MLPMFSEQSVQCRTGGSTVVKRRRTTMSGLRYRLRKAREELGISQSEAARLLHCTRSSVSQWEKGINEPTSMRLREIAQVYETSHEYLANGVDAIRRDVIPLKPGSIKDETQRAECLEAQALVKHAQFWRLETKMMAGGNLTKNDIVVVEPTHTAEPGDIVITQFEDRGFLIRVYFPPYLYALPLRAQAAPLKVDGKQIS